MPSPHQRPAHTSTSLWLSSSHFLLHPANMESSCAFFTTLIESIRLRYLGTVTFSPCVSRWPGIMWRRRTQLFSGESARALWLHLSLQQMVAWLRMLMAACRWTLQMLTLEVECWTWEMSRYSCKEWRRYSKCVMIGLHQYTQYTVRFSLKWHIQQLLE